MTNIATASFETGHIYGTSRPFSIGKPGRPETVNFDDIQDHIFYAEIILGQKIQTYLEGKFSTVKRLFFHDDVLPRKQQELSKDQGRWELFMQVPPEQVRQILELQGIPRSELIVQNEYALIQEALDVSIPEIIQSTSHNDIWRFDKEKNILRGPKVKVGKRRKQSKIRLLGYRDYQDIPSCEVLDYTFYKKRLEMSTPTVTLISEDMKGQQDKVRQLFTLSGIQPEIVVMYHDGEKIIDGEYWGEGNYESVKDEILVQDMSVE